jgi:hypothetical protein
MPSLYENLPVYKKALDLAIYIETIVRSFSRYHKYTVGSDLRNLSKRILVLVARANSKDERSVSLKEAIERIEELKILIRVCKEIKAFSSFKSFEHTTRLAIDVARQCEGWYRSRNS